ncbi:outer membrane beta-barrel protein [Mucilaginibacter gotjawali]|uniref:Uncharacterized protein n=2 Tax=Mucilaginibacter gotjawali TaxID=1550579 RepID=A0A839SP62_9SPHI|nr:outer membrane beta-barrel protein [Mucilaginibacter gotjawali]MBB3059173.1 hypothetical protein [Mucilaginibacter gotjawali]BAU52240.1 hypothetical protein MgSA37_00390 [Mucilaginibacter gotjawali]
MKNSLKYLKLWQKKRGEMQVNDDPQADWLRIQSLLDEQMPEVKRLSGFKRLKILPTFFIAFSAAAMVYMVSNIVSLEKNKHPVKHGYHHTANFIPDSANQSQAIAVDSLNPAGSGTAADSTGLTGETAQNADSSLVKPINDEAATNRTKPAKNVGVAGGQAPAGQVSGGINAQNKTVSASKGFGQRTALSNLLHVSGQRNNTGLHAAGRGAKGLVQSRYPGHALLPNAPNSNNEPVSDAITPNLFTGTQNASVSRDNPFIAAVKPQIDFTAISAVHPVNLPAFGSGLVPTGSGQPPAAKNTKGKTAKAKNNKPSDIDWGILTGVNSAGSFTPKNQNANFYGSSPVDLYFGLFVSYKVNATWAIAPQLRLFSPQTITTTYSHANNSKVDSNQNLTITSSRKVYALSVPIYAVYNATSNLSIKAGPVINFPIKQINTNSLLQPATLKADSAYYTNIIGIINKTKYDQKLNFGISAGASYKYKRFIFEAAYLKSLSGYSVTSGLGSYKSYNGTFQFTIGFQLDKLKP